MPRPLLAVVYCSVLVTSGLGPLVAQERLGPLPRAHLPEDHSVTWALASIDADSDGDLDLVIGTSGANALWLNDGRGVFGPSAPGQIPGYVELTTAIAVGDVDGNGEQDMIWGNSGTQNRLLLNFSGRFFDSTAGGLPPLADTTGSLALFDVDGDGDLDLVVGNSSGFSNRLLENDGAGRFTDVTGGRLPGVGGLNSFAADLDPFDADGDGDTDLLIVDPNNGAVLLFNDGTGWFSPGPALPALGVPWTAAAGDVDSDGDLDLFVGRRSSNPTLRRDVLLLNDGTGRFVDGTAGRVPTTDNWTADVAMADLDGDGDLDILSGSDRISPLGTRLGLVLYLGDGTGSFSDGATHLPQNDLRAVTSILLDVDSDGDLEVAFSDPDAGHQLYWNDRGGFVPATGPRLPFRLSYTEGAAAGDLDGDGDLDIVAVGWNFSILGGMNRLLVNDGTGGFDELATPPSFPWGFFASAALGDVDGDGDLDMVFGLDQPGQNMLYRNDGGLSFTDLTAQLPAAMDFTKVVRLFDADGDGDLDLLAGNTGQSTLAVNDGTGRFTDVTGQWLPSGGVTYDVAVGDVDGDGDPDLVVGNYGRNYLWLNQGNSFADASVRLPANDQDTEAVALADVDGDGDLDMLVGNVSTLGRDPRSWLHLNDGTGGFSGASIGLGRTDVKAIATGDLEHDGDVDFVLGGDGVPLRLFENVGSGLLLSQASSLPTGSRHTEILVLADVDGDGDLDLFEGDHGDDRLLFGLHRQLASRRLAITGGRLELELHVEPGSSLVTPIAFLFFGMPAGVPWQTPLGLARLSPNGLIVLPSVTFPAAQTTAIVELGVPDSPALIGLRGGFQALVAHGTAPADWALSGLVMETVLR